MRFDHEKLNVYQHSIQFCMWVEEKCGRLDKRTGVLDQLDRASTSIALNIAEGNGKYHSPDRCRFFDIARGSALECAACLDVLVARGRLTDAEVGEGKERLRSIVSMIVGLIRSNSDRVCDESGPRYDVASLQPDKD